MFYTLWTHLRPPRGGFFVPFLLEVFIGLYKILVYLRSARPRAVALLTIRINSLRHRQQPPKKDQQGPAPPRAGLPSY